MDTAEEEATWLTPRDTKACEPSFCLVLKPNHLSMVDRQFPTSGSHAFYKRHFAKRSFDAASSERDKDYVRGPRGRKSRREFYAALRAENDVSNLRCLLQIATLPTGCVLVFFSGATVQEPRYDCLAQVCATSPSGASTPRRANATRTTSAGRAGACRDASSSRAENDVSTVRRQMLVTGIPSTLRLSS